MAVIQVPFKSRGPVVIHARLFLQEPIYNTSSLTPKIGVYVTMFTLSFSVQLTDKQQYVLMLRSRCLSVSS